MAKVVVVANQKGGVGKTVICNNLVHAAVADQRSVVLIDFDTQGNSSQFLTGNMGIARMRGGAEQLFTQGQWMYSDVLNGAASLLHGHRHLDELDENSSGTLRAAIELRRTIRSLPFDYVIIDTPPSIGPRHVAPLFWADLVVIAVEPNLASLTGLEAILDTVRGAKKVNPSLAYRLVINRFMKASARQKQAVGSLRQKFGEQIIGEMALRAAVADALADRQPVWQHARADKELRTAWHDMSSRILNMIA